MFIIFVTDFFKTFLTVCSLFSCPSCNRIAQKQNQDDWTPVWSPIPHSDTHSVSRVAVKKETQSFRNDHENGKRLRTRYAVII